MSILWMCSTGEPGCPVRQTGHLFSWPVAGAGHLEGPFWVLWVGSGPSCSEGAVQLETSSVLPLLIFRGSYGSASQGLTAEGSHSGARSETWAGSPSDLGRCPWLKPLTSSSFFSFCKWRKGTWSSLVPLPRVMHLVSSRPAPGELGGWSDS